MLASAALQPLSEQLIIDIASDVKQGGEKAPWQEAQASSDSGERP